MHHHLHILFLLTPLINALAPRPPTAFLSSYAFSGTGCPATSSAATLSSSLEKISINLSDSYQVSIGPSIPVVQNRKNCQMNLNISIPTNSRWQLCVGPTTFTGFADLQTNVSATARNSYYFAGSVVSNANTMNVKGPREGSFSVVTDSINGCENYSACGNEMQLNVNSQLQVQSTTAGNTGNVVIGGEAAGMDIALSWVYC